jgi:hypothetical protein
MMLLFPELWPREDRENWQTQAAVSFSSLTIS